VDQAENKRLIAEHGMSGHFGTWPQSVDMVALRAVANLLIDAAAKKIDIRTRSRCRSTSKPRPVVR
jgi:hypothetical protein